MAKEKIFSGEECLKSSRWEDVLPTWPKEQKKRIEGRIDELLKENEEYQSADNHGHLSNLLTGLALYEMYLSEGKSKEEAMRLTAEPMWAYVEKGAGLYRKAVKIPGAIRPFGMVKWIVQVHGGKITAASTPGMGSAFDFNFPVIPVRRAGKQYRMS